MKRRWTGAGALLAWLLGGCGGEVRNTPSEALLAQGAEDATQARHVGALAATRVGLAAFTRMLGDESLRRAQRIGAPQHSAALEEAEQSAPRERAEALFSLWQNVVEAHEGAQYSFEQLAFAAHAGARAVAEESGALDEDDARDARAGVERVRARVVARSVEQRFSTLTSRADLRGALGAAGARLEADVEAALAEGGRALEARLEGAWARYVEDTEGLLEEALAARGTAALAAAHRLRAFVAWEAEGLSLSAAGLPAADEDALDVIVDGLGSYYASICSAGTASQLDAAGLTPGEADAALAILANLYAAAA